MVQSHVLGGVPSVMWLELCVPIGWYLNVVTELLEFKLLSNGSQNEATKMDYGNVGSGIN